MIKVSYHAQGQTGSSYLITRSTAVDFGKLMPAINIPVATTGPSPTELASTPTLVDFDSDERLTGFCGEAIKNAVA